MPDIVRMVIGGLLGAGAGYLWYRLVGCNGSCPLTGNPWSSMGFGLFAGLLLAWK